MSITMPRALVGRLVVGGVILAAGWWLLNSPVLAFGGVSVDGYDGSDRAELELALTREADQGNLFQLPRDEIRSAATRFPAVGDIAVTRSWPRSLEIKVIPARPIAALVSNKGASVVVSSRGRVIGPAPKRHELPRLLVTGATPKPGSSIPKEAKPGFTFVRGLEPEIAARIRALHVSASRRLEGRLTGSGALIVGRPERPVARAAALASVLNNLSDEDQAAARYIDLSVPERPAVGFGAPAVPAAQLAAEPKPSSRDVDTDA